MTNCNLVNRVGRMKDPIIVANKTDVSKILTARSKGWRIEIKSQYLTPDQCLMLVDHHAIPFHTIQQNETKLYCFLPPTMLS